MAGLLPNFVHKGIQRAIFGASPSASGMAESFGALSTQTLAGEDISFADRAGKVTLVTNVACK